MLRSDFARIAILLCLCAIAVLAVAQQSKIDKSGLATQLNIDAYQKLKQGEYQQSYKTSKQALFYSKKENNPVQLARAKSNLASNLFYLGEYEKALNLYTQSLVISQSENDLSGINRALNNIANIYSHLDNPSEVLKYRNLQLENSLLAINIEDQLIAYIGLTDIHAELNNYNKAKTFNLLAKSLLDENQDPFLRVYTLISESTIFENQNDYQSALSNMKKALSIAKKNNFNGLVASAQANIADYYYALGDYEEATEMAQLSLIDAEQRGLKSSILQAHLLLSKIYQSKHDFEKALSHTQLANQVSESLSGEKIRLLAEITKIDRQITKTEEKLKNAQQNQQILKLKLERQQDTLIIWLFLISIVCIVVFLLYYRMTSKKEIIRQKKANERLRELDSIKDRILHNTSHELRTPLNGIIGLSEIIISDASSDLPPSILKYIKLIKSSGEQLSLVVNDILEVSKLKNQAITIVKSQFSLNELIEDVVILCEPLATKKKLVIHYQNSIENNLVNQDRQRLQQILFNVVGNAVKFTFEGNIRIETMRDKREIIISISDTGIGIPSDKLERVFEGFEQVDASNSRDNSGSGLGLAISRGLTEALGGSLILSSTLGKGTSIDINLPAL